jgi:hypothetical protein
MKLPVQTQRRQGQVLVLVTLVLFAMVGMLGLAVDLGWSYFIRKSAQTAADAAAMAAVQEGYLHEDDNDNNTTYECVTEVTCQPLTQCPHPVPNPPTNNIENGCLYAEQNGFSTDPQGRQNVTMHANNTFPPPTAPGVFAYYWVTARVTEGLPQLFSSLMGNTYTTTSARATAAIVDSVILGSLILLNREDDCVPLDVGSQVICGVDLLVQANNNQGMDAVRAPFTFIRGAGEVDLGGSSQWVLPPENGYSDRSYFKDPMRGKGQPPPPTGLSDRPILGAHILGSNDPNAPLILDPGNYYATRMVGGQEVVTGDPMTMSGYIRFSSGGAGFGNYVFFGGFRNQSAGTEVTFDPGRYVFAGTKHIGANAGSLFDVQVNMSISDLTPTNGRNSDPGEIFIFTDTNYPGLEVPVTVQPVADQLRHGVSGFQTGNNADIFVRVHGLNRDHPALPADLKDFAPVVLWQDQANSVIEYTSRGYIDTSCGQPECPNTALDDPESTEMFFKASPNLHLYGIAYQPRGAFTSMVGGGGFDSPLQLIAGALMVHGNANVRLQELNNPLFVKIVSLVE